MDIKNQPNGPKKVLFLEAPKIEFYYYKKFQVVYNIIKFMQ
jgi:hypothetical protein